MKDLFKNQPLLVFVLYALAVVGVVFGLIYRRGLLLVIAAVGALIANNQLRKLLGNA